MEYVQLSQRGCPFKVKTFIPTFFFFWNATKEFCFNYTLGLIINNIVNNIEINLPMGVWLLIGTLRTVGNLADQNEL